MSAIERHGVGEIAPPLAGLTLQVTDRADRIAGSWRALEADAVGHVFQTHDWMTHWIANVAPARDVTLRLVLAEWPDGSPAAVLPLGVRRNRGVRVAAWLGGESADYHGGLFAPALFDTLCADAALLRRFVDDVTAAIGPIDLVHFTRQPETLGGKANPFLSLPRYANASAAHSTWLGDDWETYYNAKRGSGWRRTDRSKLRRLRELGDISVIAGDQPAMRQRILDTLFEQKRQGLANMGVPDMFAPSGVRAFYEALADAHYPDGPAHLCALACDDRLIACNFGVVRGDTYYYVLHSYDTADDLRPLSPGRALMYELMQWAIARGFPHFDFTIGDEGYKESWCESRLGLTDCILPVTLAGRMAAASYRISEGVKRTIKNDRRLWSAAKFVRLRLAGN